MQLRKDPFEKQLAPQNGRRTIAQFAAVEELISDDLRLRGELGPSQIDLLQRIGSWVYVPVVGLE
jgi:hypothetical protein